MERRNNLEITAEILRLAEKGARKTHIAYGANLNHKFLEDYLSRLEEKNLIEMTKKRVKTTEKGLMFAQQYGSLLQLVNL